MSAIKIRAKVVIFPSLTKTKCMFIIIIFCQVKNALVGDVVV